MDKLVEKTYRVKTPIGSFRVRAYDEEGAISRVLVTMDLPTLKVTLIR